MFSGNKSCGGIFAPSTRAGIRGISRCRAAAISTRADHGDQHVTGGDLGGQPLHEIDPQRDTVDVKEQVFAAKLRDKTIAQPTCLSA